MINAKSYTHYISVNNAYGRICTVNSGIGLSEFTIEVKYFVPSRNKYIRQRIEILSNDNYVIYSCPDAVKQINFRVGFMPQDWNEHRRYIERDCVFYKGSVYACSSTSQGTKPSDTSKWNKASNYEAKSYNTNEIVMYADNRYYVALRDVTSADKPNVSNGWKKLSGDFTLYASILESGGHFETTLLQGDENLIDLYPYDSMTFYLGDSWYQNIDGINALTPVIKSWEELTYGRMFFLEESVQSKCITTKPNNGGTKFYKLMSFSEIKDTSIMITLRIENIWCGDYSVFGYAKVVITGNNLENSSAIIRKHNDNNFDKINLFVTKGNERMFLYFECDGNRYRIKIEDIDCYSSKENNQNQSSTIIKTHHTTEGTTSYDGTIIEKLNW